MSQPPQWEVTLWNCGPNGGSEKPCQQRPRPVQCREVGARVRRSEACRCHARWGEPDREFGKRNAACSIVPPERASGELGRARPSWSSRSHGCAREVRCPFGFALRDYVGLGSFLIGAENKERSRIPTSARKLEPEWYWQVARRGHVRGKSSAPRPSWGRKTLVHMRPQRPRKEVDRRRAALH